MFVVCLYAPPCTWKVVDVNCNVVSWLETMIKSRISCWDIVIVMRLIAHVESILPFSYFFVKLQDIIFWIIQITWILVGLRGWFRFVINWFAAENHVIICVYLGISFTWNKNISISSMIFSFFASNCSCQGICKSFFCMINKYLMVAWWLGFWISMLEDKVLHAIKWIHF